jgi:carbonic anhydrase
VGHYGCAGVKAALEGRRVGLADNWLRHIRDVADRHREILELLPEHGRANALCELNVIEQVVNVAHSTVLQDAWTRGQNVTLHGWVYGLQDGLLQDLHITVANMDELQAKYREAVSGVRLVPRLA